MNRREGRAIRQGGSVLVVLPADFVRGHRIRPGDKVTVEYTDDEVTIRPLDRAGVAR